MSNPVNSYNFHPEEQNTIAPPSPREDYPQSSNRGCRERLSRPPIKQFPCTATRSLISYYLYTLKFAEIRVWSSRTRFRFREGLILSLFFFFFFFSWPVSFSRQTILSPDNTSQGLLLCYGIACLLSHLASIPTYFSYSYAFESDPLSHFVPLITFAEAFRIGNLCLEICVGTLFIVDHVSRHNLIERNKFGGRRNGVLWK